MSFLQKEKNTITTTVNLSYGSSKLFEHVNKTEKIFGRCEIEGKILASQN